MWEKREGFEALAGLPDPAGFSRTRVDLEQWRVGDQDALDRIFRRYEPALHSIISRRLNRIASRATRARLSPEDLVNEAAVTILAKLADFEYRGPGSLRAWMEAIASHTISDAVDRLQAQKRQAELERALPSSDEQSQESMPGLATQDAGPSTVVERSEGRERIHEVLAALPERDYLIVQLRYFFGEEWDEIARELSFPSSDAARKAWTRLALKLEATFRDA